MKFKIGDRVARFDITWNDDTVKVGEVVSIYSESDKNQYNVYYRVSFGPSSFENLLGCELHYVEDYTQTIKPIPSVRYISIGSSEDARTFEPESTKPTGGSSEYYDFNPEWETLNDLMDEKAEYQWKEHTHYLHNIMKAAFRWGAKNGTSKGYDARKIVYYALRILRSLEGREAVQKELKSLIEDKQFLEYNDVVEIDGDE